MTEGVDSEQKTEGLKNMPMNNYYKKQRIKLRPHHCICIQFFEGKGYDEDFVKNMSEIIACLEKNDPPVELTAGCDDICAFCPNNVDGDCQTAEKVSGIDNRCMNEAGLKTEPYADWYVIRDSVKKNIIDSGRLAEICKDCCWIEICAGSIPHGAERDS